MKKTPPMKTNVPVDVPPKVANIPKTPKQAPMATTKPTAKPKNKATYL